MIALVGARTRDLVVKSHLLYQLSYERLVGQAIIIARYLGLRKITLEHHHFGSECS